MPICLRKLLPTPSWLRLALVPVLAFVATVTDRNYLADFWHHLARGKAMVQQGAIVDRDQFTCTVAGQPFQDVNWLTQVGYYHLFMIGDLALVQVVNSLIIAFTFLVLVGLCWRRSGSLMAAAIAGGVAFFGVWEVLTIRPQTLSMLLFVLLLDVLERSERRPWLLVLPPFLVALWANLHGAFPAGILLVGCAWIASMPFHLFWTAPAAAHRSPSRCIMLAACLLACISASLINPYGWEIYRYVSATSSIAYERQIAEWVRPGPDRLIGWMWIVSSVGIFGLVCWRVLSTRQTPATTDLLMLACFFMMSCGSVRMVAWWMLASAPILSTHLVWLAPKLMPGPADDDEPSFAVSGFFTLFALAVIFSLPGLDRFNPLLGPTRRGQRLETDLQNIQCRLASTAAPGNIYSHFEWGEFLSWAAPPRHKIFMDGRIEIYPDEVWRKYTLVTTGGDGWDQILGEFDVNYLILDASYHRRSGLWDRVNASPQWRPEFQSGSAVLFIRQPNATPGPQVQD